LRFGSRNVDLYVVERAPYPVYHEERKKGKGRGRGNKGNPRTRNRGEIVQPYAEIE
jgi:hypothetical protein